MHELFIAVCDDDEISLEAISSLVRKQVESNGLSCTIDRFLSPTVFKDNFARNKYDLILLDIEMPKINGIELASLIRQNDSSAVICFISSREDKVFDSLSVHPFAFIRKSHFTDDVTKAIHDYLETLSKKNDLSIELEVKGAIRTFSINDLMEIESYRNYQYLRVRGIKEPVEIKYTMEDLEKRLSPYGFLRVHKGALVNYLFIKRIDAHELTLSDDRKVPIPRRKLQEVREAYLRLLRENGTVLLTR